MRPEIFARIGTLKINQISPDLHTIADFARDTQQIDNLVIGNKGFRLFHTTKLDDFVGLEPPSKAVFLGTDRQNLYTLIQLLRKSKMVSIEDLATTSALLKFISENEAHFPNITGLHITYDVQYNELINSIPDSLLGRCRKLSLTEKTESSTFFSTV